MLNEFRNTLTEIASLQYCETETRKGWYDSVMQPPAITEYQHGSAWILVSPPETHRAQEG